MNELVPKGVDPIEHHTEYCWCVAVGQRQSCCFFPTGKTIFPLFFADFSALMIPEALEDILVVQQPAFKGVAIKFAEGAAKAAGTGVVAVLKAHIGTV